MRDFLTPFAHLVVILFACSTSAIADSSNQSTETAQLDEIIDEGRKNSIRTMVSAIMQCYAPYRQLTFRN